MRMIPRHARKARRPLLALAASIIAGTSAMQAAARVPDWVQSHASAVTPTVTADQGAVLLYSDTQVSVSRDGTVKRAVRTVYRALSQKFASNAVAQVVTNPRIRLLGLRAWSISPNGETDSVGESDAVESALPVVNGLLFTDLRMKLLREPKVVPNGIFASEVVTEERTIVLIDEWEPRATIPVIEAHYELELPKDWQARPSWIGRAEEPVVMKAPNIWSWTLRDQKAVRIETFMPPWEATAGELMVSIVPSPGHEAGFQTWNEMGAWYSTLTRGRQEVTKEMAQKIAELTKKDSTPLEKAQILAEYVQKGVRYVAIELGIGTYMPHSASEVFSNQYGDCKDKATLLASMLRAIGIDSHYVIVNTRRGAVAANTPAHFAFNHMILAISVPGANDDPHLLAVLDHPALGRLLIFDPTDHLTPFGMLAGPLQGGYGLLVTPSGGELVQLPQLPASANSIQRTGTMTLDPIGTLTGEVREQWNGDQASAERARLRNLYESTERERILKDRLAQFFTSFDLLKASLSDVRDTSGPLMWRYSIEAQRYAKSTDNLLILRPRILATEASSFLETNEPRENPVEFAAPMLNTDEFDISVPAGYRAEDLPDPVNLESDFVAYHSRTQLAGQAIRYSRSFEIKRVSVPVDKVEELRKVFRAIRNDENRQVVLVRTASDGVRQ
jgi:hypothetical protein